MLSFPMCYDFLRDRTHRFRRMWAAQAWAPMNEGEPACWERRRDAADQWQSADTFFDELLEGAHCASNWFEGNFGKLGKKDHVPTFGKTAPALLGFDESIDAFCAARLGGGQQDLGHAQKCVAASLNILSLYGQRVQCTHSAQPRP